MNVELWSMIANNNNATPPDGAPEGMLRTLFNDTLREIMAAVRRWYDAPEWLNLFGTAVVSRIDNSNVRIAGVDVTAYYTPGRRVKMTGSSTIYGTVNTSAFSGGNTNLNITTDNTVPVPNPTSAIYANIVESLRTGGTVSTGTTPGTIPLNSGSGALGSAAYKNTSTSSGDVPTNSQNGALASGAYTAVGTNIGQLPANTRNGPLEGLAYRVVPTRVYFAKTGADQGPVTAEAIITGLQGLDCAANGTKQCKIQCLINVRNLGAGNATITLRLRRGNFGLITDTIVYTQVVTVGAGQDAQILADFVDTPPANNLYSPTLQSSAASGATIWGGGGTATQISTAWIEEIL